MPKTARVQTLLNNPLTKLQRIVDNACVTHWDFFGVDMKEFHVSEEYFQGLLEYFTSIGVDPTQREQVAKAKKMTLVGGQHFDEVEIIPVDHRKTGAAVK